MLANHERAERRRARLGSRLADEECADRHRAQKKRGGVAAHVERVCFARCACVAARRSQVENRAAGRRQERGFFENPW